MPPSKAAPSKEALRNASKTYARKKVAAVFADSELKDHTDKIPQFERSEIVMGKLLGKGGFGTVKEVRSFQVHENVKKWKPKKGEEDPQVAEGEREGRKFIATHVMRGTGHARYAVKYLSEEVIEDPGKFVQAIIDMDIETRLLSSLEHTNLVKLRAVANVDPVDEQYFIVLDRLYDILDKRMDKWKAQLKRCTGFSAKLNDRKGEKAAALLEERLLVAFDLCSALEYLHSNNVLYRDIKPENIGFDVRGDVKIFDFGLSVELRPQRRLADGTYKLTGNTGSMVYMAPEVALERTYNDTADVYSMTILMYEMLALREPYPVTYTLKMYKEKVHLGHKRPKLDGLSLSPQVQAFLKKGWDPDNIRGRANMTELAKMVKDEVVRVRGDGDGIDLDQERRRSSFQRKTSSFVEDTSNRSSQTCS